MILVWAEVVELWVCSRRQGMGMFLTDCGRLPNWGVIGRRRGKRCKASDDSGYPQLTQKYVTILSFILEKILQNALPNPHRGLSFISEDYY